MSLMTEAELAADFGIDEQKAAELRRKHDWPHVRLSRFDVRYTEEQVRQIVDSHSHRASAPAAAPTGPIAGQSAKSAARRRR